MTIIQNNFETKSHYQNSLIEYTKIEKKPRYAEKLSEPEPCIWCSTFVWDQFKYSKKVVDENKLLVNKRSPNKLWLFNYNDKIIQERRKNLNHSVYPLKYKWIVFKMTEMIVSASAASFPGISSSTSSTRRHIPPLRNRFSPRIAPVWAVSVLFYCSRPLAAPIERIGI